MKLMAVAVMALLLLSVTAYAQEAATAEEPVDETTAKEVKAVMEPKGAEVRLLQLEESIQRNMLFGEKILEKIEADYSSYDTTGLESLLDELSLLKDEVAATDPEGEASEVAKAFVDLKNDAREIAAEFRTLVHEAISETEAENLKAQIGGEVSAQMEQVRERVRNAIRNHNEQVVQNKLSQMSKTNSQLVEKVKNGEVTADQVKTQLRDMIQQMTQEEKNKAVAAMKNAMTSLSARTQSAIQAATEGYQERLQARLTERLQSMSSGDGSKLKERIDSITEAASSGTGTGAGTGTQGGGSA